MSLLNSNNSVSNINTAVQDQHHEKKLSPITTIEEDTVLISASNFHAFCGLQLQSFDAVREWNTNKSAGIQIDDGHRAVKKRKLLDESTSTANATDLSIPFTILEQGDCVIHSKRGLWNSKEVLEIKKQHEATQKKLKEMSRDTLSQETVAECVEIRISFTDSCKAFRISTHSATVS
jgi:hypothetical protein